MQKGVKNAMDGLTFRKNGAEIKAAAIRRITHIQQRLDRRNQNLQEFMGNPEMVRSYLVRSSKAVGATSQRVSLLIGDGDMAGEYLEEIRQLCERIYDLEQEMKRLRLVVSHLADDAVFHVSASDLADYGFEEQ